MAWNWKKLNAAKKGLIRRGAVALVAYEVVFVGAMFVGRPREADGGHAVGDGGADAAAGAGIHWGAGAVPGRRGGRVSSAGWWCGACCGGWRR